MVWLGVVDIPLSRIGLGCRGVWIVHVVEDTFLTTVEARFCRRGCVLLKNTVTLLRLGADSSRFYVGARAVDCLYILS